MGKGQMPEWNGRFAAPNLLLALTHYCNRRRRTSRTTPESTVRRTDPQLMQFDSGRPNEKEEKVWSIPRTNHTFGLSPKPFVTHLTEPGVPEVFASKSCVGAGLSSVL